MYFLQYSTIDCLLLSITLHHAQNSPAHLTRCNQTVPMTNNEYLTPKNLAKFLAFSSKNCILSPSDLRDSTWQPVASAKIPFKPRLNQHLWCPFASTRFLREIVRREKEVLSRERRWFFSFFMAQKVVGLYKCIPLFLIAVEDQLLPKRGSEESGRMREVYRGIIP